MTGPIRVVLALAAAVALGGCGERSQDLPPAAKAGQPSWQGAGNPHVADGWKPGDQASWEEQMRRRTQSQNEYARISGAS